MHPLKQTLLLALALTLPLAGAKAITFTSNTAIGVGNTTYDGQEIIVSGCTLTVDGQHSFASLLLTNGASLTHSPAPNGETNNRIDLTIAGDVTIDATSRMDADAKGFGSSAGPGAGASGQFAGGGYGGVGGRSSGYAGGAAYGSIIAPQDHGSGGGYGSQSLGGSGGGLIRLTVGGTLTVNGALRADGQSGATTGCTYGGGGAGGSIYLSVGTLAGSGSITARGGAGYYFSCADGTAGGGGGGRIAAYFQTNLFAGLLQATGGAGYERGGAGTVYLKAADANVGDLIVDNAGTNGALTLLTSPTAFNVLITNAASAYSAAPVTFNHLIVASGGTLTHLPAELGVQVTCLGNATIESGGAIAVAGKGYGRATGPGAAQYGGAGHGGNGGAMGDIGGGGGAYGSAIAPVDFGSGGGMASNGGRGGGLVRLTVAGTLRVNGVINASGEDGGQSGCTYGSGGAGGSVFLAVGELTGSGSIIANGGRGWYSGCSGITSGGGGGGRIAAYFQTNLFAGLLQAVGGAGYERGGAGTLYLKAANVNVGDLIVDNAGTNGALTLLTSPIAFNVLLTNGALAYSAAPVTFNHFTVASGGTLTHLPAVLGVQVTCLGDATIESGGAIAAAGLGYGRAVGPGAAQWGGAGHGGNGGAMVGIGGGGTAYGSAEAPVNFGSGGGTAGNGGRGGGLVRLTVAGTLRVNGIINASGEDGVQSGCTYGSGGAGGSVFLAVGELTGSGSIIANGGRGWYSGCSGITSGGGAGGRLAIYGDISQVEPPTLSVLGGWGAQSGQSGSYFTSTNVPPVIMAQTPSGLVPHFVSHVDVTLNQAVDPTTFGPGDVVLSTPSGTLPTGQITVTPIANPTWRISFPLQAANGAYALTVGPQIANLFGQTMSTAYQGTFTIEFTPPTLSCTASNGSLHLAWPSVNGVNYQVQSTTNLPALNWLNEGPPFPGTGGVLATNLPLGPTPAKFFRVRADN